MKKIQYYKLFFGIIMMIAFTGCTKLKDKPYGSLDASTYNITVADLQGFIINAYSPVRSYATNWQNDVCSDEFCIPGRPNGWVNGGVFERMHLHNFQALDEADTWNSGYGGIQLCNQILDFMIASGRVKLDPVKEKQVVAEMKALRAFYHAWILDAYQNAPFVTKFSTATKQAQLAPAALFDSIVNDLKAVIPDLQEPSSEFYGRMNKYSASFLLARLYLNAKVYTGSEKYAECITECDKIINSNKYSLDANFKNIFAVKNENTPESIFAAPFDSKNTPGLNRGQQSLHPANQATYKMENAGWGGPCAIPQFVDTYSPQDSRLKDTYVQGLQVAFDGSPIIINAGTAAATQLNIKNYLQNISFSELEYGYRYGKYEYEIPLKINMSNDFQVFRYAEVLFMKAECLLRIGSPDAAAIIVTNVRQRAFKANPALATVTGAQLQLGSSYRYGRYENGVNTTNEGGGDIQFGRMMDEWGWEFATEFRRRPLLNRFDVFTRKSWLSHLPSGVNKRIFPIPPNEVQQGYRQNPGY